MVSLEKLYTIWILFL